LSRYTFTASTQCGCCEAFSPISGPRPRRRIYDDAVREALIVVWEASDRICGRRLRPLVPIMLEAMERHGHLQLAPEVRTGLLAMSAATIDRALCDIRGKREEELAAAWRPRPPSGAACRCARSPSGATLRQDSLRRT
jgi:hypothetical protein